MWKELGMATKHPLDGTKASSTAGGRPQTCNRLPCSRGEGMKPRQHWGRQAKKQTENAWFLNYGGRWMTTCRPVSPAYEPGASYCGIVFQAALIATARHPYLSSFGCFAYTSTATTVSTSGRTVSTIKGGTKASSTKANPLEFLFKCPVVTLTSAFGRGPGSTAKRSLRPVLRFPVTRKRTPSPTLGDWDPIQASPSIPTSRSRSTKTFARLSSAASRVTKPIPKSVQSQLAPSDRTET